MSLLTPPSTAHRRSKEKENTPSDVASSSRVVWAENDKIHLLQLIGPATASLKVNTAASASKKPPLKSILKKSPKTESWPAEKQREMTPEPADPMVNLTYLQYPMSTILDATDATELRDLVEAYSILTARLRAAVTGATDADASWPLFQPIRKRVADFADAVVRDLGRALVDPTLTPQEPVEPVRVLLPSPTNTPVKKKKRDGLTAEQVKYARDLCTTSHAVIRLLSLIFTLPALMNLFTDKQLSSMLTAVLAIPLADELPTPNARKTWSLAVWLIQFQRLSADVLAPAADRIALALCRGIDGELGKEGKKGAASDGLRAVHDLSIYLPEVFIPAFTHSVLPSVLTSLLAPTLALRISAANALGGFVIGATTIPNAPIHAQISSAVLKYFTTLPPPPKPLSPIKQTTSSSTTPASTTPLKFTPPRTPTRPAEPAIVKTLRNTLETPDPTSVGQGPVWSICVLSAIIVLLGPMAMRAPYLRGLITAGMSHKNRNVRTLTTVLWRAVLWVYICPRFITVDENGEEVAVVDEREREREIKYRDEWWRIVASVVENEMGVCSIAATIGSGNVGVPIFEPEMWVDERLSFDEREEQPLRRALEVLVTMAGKDTPTRKTAVDTMRALVGLPMNMSKENMDAMEFEKDEKTLLPKGLYSALPGLLTTDFAALKDVVKVLFDEMPKAEDVRRLTRAEVGKEWVWEGLVRVWREAVCAGKGMACQDGKRERKALLDVWEGMISMGLGAALDPNSDDPDRDIDASPPPHDEELVIEFVERATNVIIVNVLEDCELDLQPSSSPLPPSKAGLIRTGSRGLEIPGFSSSPKSSAAKLELATEMWSIICRLAPHACVGTAAESLANCLLKGAEEYTTFGSSVGRLEEGGEDEKEMNEKWADICVDVLAACEPELVQEFWYCAKGKRAIGWRGADRALVWRAFARGWVLQNSDARWEGAVCTLAVPFCGRETWVLTSEDGDMWQKLLDFAVAASLDHGHDANMVLGAVAGLVAEENESRYKSSHVRLVEFVLGYLATMASKGDLRELPEAVLDFVAKSIHSAYPPSEDQTTYTWAMRAITSLIDQCPRDLLKALGESLSDALATWLADADDKWEKGVIEYDIVALYETLLASIQGRASIHLLSAFGPTLSAPMGPETRQEIREPAVEAFKEFWNSTYANVEIPKGGWDRDVEACLTSVFGASKEEVIAELEPAFSPRPTTPTPNSTLSVPSTPRSSLSDSHFTPQTLSTPPRPSKAARPFAQFSMQSPVSPMPSSSRLSALSHPPTPRTGRSSPAKRRKLVHGDKENVSPSKNISITSVIDRIIASSPVATKAVLGKRRFEEDTHLVGSSEDDRNTVESLLLPSKSDVFFVSSSSTSIEPRATYKKRKRVSQDDPSDKHSLRPSASFELPHVPSTHKWSVRRTSSESTMSGHEMAHSRKRRKEEMESDGEEVVCFGEVPLRALVPSENRMSPAMYRPYSLVRRHSKSMVPSSEISSDDDPRLGQVTPHHLISPDIRRGKNIRPQDPPSDDSDVMPSPSRDLVERRLQRTGSGSIVKITPFIVL